MSDRPPEPSICAARPDGNLRLGPSLRDVEPARQMFEYGGGAGDQPRTDRTSGRQILAAHRPLAAVAQPFVEAARLVICSQHNPSRSSNESARLNELHERRPCPWPRSSLSI